MTSILVSVVLPCLNEQDSVGLCVTEALDAMTGGGLPGEVIVVDNGSTDDSVKVAQAAGARIVYEKRPGYGSALLAGFDSAVGDVVVMADADFTYELERIPDLVAPVLEGRADLVLGSRLDSATRGTMPLAHRFIGTPILTFLTARACGRRVVTDSQSGFRAFRRDALPVMGLTSTGMELASEMLILSARAGLRIEEIQTKYRPRIGESKLATWSDGWRHLLLIFLLAPDLLLIGPALTLLALGLVMLIMTFFQPGGVQIGSYVWQPVFFSGIALVLGTQALLAGTVLAHNSSIAALGTRQRFAFVGKPTFPKRCVTSGVVLVLVGLGLNVVLFVGWLANKNQSALSHFGLASLSQSLIITGGTLASFGIISRFLRARAARVPVTTHRASDGRGSATMATTASSLSDVDGESTRFVTGSADGPTDQLAPATDLAFTPEARAREDGLGPVGQD
jgi:glycosyltransferase involved in cell wall biosynthesis